jgi:hypothetical protein
MRVLCFLVASVVLVAALPSPDRLSMLELGSTTGGAAAYGSLNVTSLTVNSGPARESRIVLGNGDSAFTLAMTSGGSFVIRHRNQPSFTVGPEGDVVVNGKVRSTGMVRVDGTINFMGVDQWLLAIAENFNSGSSGWTNATTTQCGPPNKRILGGYGQFAGGEVTKTYRQLPEHNEIRVKATFHFIDAWQGETAFAKLDHQVVWTDMHDQMATKNGVNICGSASTTEGKFAVPIDVVIPHTSSSLAVSFGSTLASSPLEASWGVSDVQVLVRKMS